MIPKFKVFPRTAYNSLGRMTLKNGSAEVPFLEVYMKGENCSKVAD